LTLKDGTEASDPRLGRLKQFDPRSRNFPIRTAVDGKPIRSYTWRVGAWLDQLSEGSCVGHAFAHELCARPVVTMVDHTYARETIYWEAQKADPWSGGMYPGATPRYEGTSILAGAQVCQSIGHFSEYRWAFSLDDLLLAIGYAGPAMLGLNWYQDMANPAPDGQIRPQGQLLGGHAILANRVQVRQKRVWLHNSWGFGWGLEGRCWLSWDDLGQLLAEDGEACIPAKRARTPTS
jgi:hypothetical protein